MLFGAKMPYNSAYVLGRAWLRASGRLSAQNRGVRNVERVLR